MFPHLWIFYSNIFFPFFFGLMIFILLFRRVLIILVTDLYRCYKYLSFHFHYIFFGWAEVLILIWSKLSIFSFMLYCVGGRWGGYVSCLGKSLAYTAGSQRYCFMFCSENQFAFHIKVLDISGIDFFVNGVGCIFKILNDPSIVC